MTAPKSVWVPGTGGLQRNADDSFEPVAITSSANNTADTPYRFRYLHEPEAVLKMCRECRKETTAPFMTVRKFNYMYYFCSIQCYVKFEKLLELSN